MNKNKKSSNMKDWLDLLNMLVRQSIPGSLNANAIASALNNDYGVDVEVFKAEDHDGTIGGVVAVEERLPASLPRGGTVSRILLIDCDIAGLNLSETIISDILLFGRAQKVVGIKSDWPETVDITDPFLNLIPFKNQKFNPDWVRHLVPINKSGSEEISSSSAAGLCLDKSTIKSLVCYGTDLFGLCARNVRITGLCEFNECLLEGILMTDYKIEGNAQLVIDNPITGLIRNCGFWTETQPEGDLILRKISFDNCRFFNKRNHKAVFSPSTVEKVAFNGCYFDDCLIKPRGDDIRLIFKEGCSLKETSFENVNGTIEVRDCEIDAAVTGDSVIDRLTIASQKLTESSLSMEDVQVKDFSFSKQRLNLEINKNVKLGPWREGGASLAGSTIVGADFSAISFVGEGLIDAEGTTFLECNFSEVKLSRFMLSKATFEDCIFKGADFSGVNADELNIKGEKTKLSGALLKNVQGLRMSKVHTSEASAINLENAFLDACTFESIDFENLKATRATIANCEFKKCSFTECDLEGVRFEKFTKFIDVDFSGQKEFNKVIFGGSSCDDETTFAGCLFQECTFSDKSLFENRAKFSDATFDSCIWQGNVLEDMTVFPFDSIEEISSAKIEGANLRHLSVKCRLNDVTLSNCNLEGVEFVGSEIKGLTINLAEGTLTFTRSEIDQLTIDGKGKENEEVQTELFFRDNPSLNDIQIKDIRLNALEICETPQLSELALNNVKVFKGGTKISSCTIKDLTIDNNSDLTGLFVDSTKFQGKRSIVSCNLSEGNWKGEECNLFDKQCVGIKDTQLHKSTFEKLTICGDLSKFKSKKVILINSDFIGCNFRGANLNSCDFTGITFDSNCNLSEVEKSHISGSKFNSARLLANIDKIRFEDCEFEGTIFSDENSDGYRKISCCSFNSCKFSSETRLDNVRFVGDETRPKLFDQCETANELIFQEVVFQKSTLENIKSVENQHFILDECSIGEIELNCNAPHFQISNSDIDSLNLKAAEISGRDACRISGSKIRSLSIENSTLRTISLDKSEIVSLKVFDTSMNNVYFNYCEFGIVYFRETATVAVDPENETEKQVDIFSDGHDSAQFVHSSPVQRGMYLDDVVFNVVVFRESLWKQAGVNGELFFMLDNIPAERCDIKLRYYRNEEPEDEQTYVFQDHKIDFHKEGNEKEFDERVRPTGFHRDAPTELCQLLTKQFRDYKALRHTTKKFDARDIKNRYKVFSSLGATIKQRNDLLSRETAERVDRLASKLYQYGYELKPEEVDPKLKKDYLDSWKELKELMEMRIASSDQEGNLRNRLRNILECDGRMKVEFDWPETGKKLYLDFGLLDKLIHHIGKNVIVHAKASQISVNGKVEVEDQKSGHVREYFSMTIGDDGEGWFEQPVTVKELKAWINDDNDPGSLTECLLKFNKGYCRCVQIGTLNKKGKKVSIDIRGEKVQKGKVDWYSGGTAYRFQVWLPMKK